MSNFFEALKQYFEVTPIDEVMDTWEKSAEFDKVSPTVENFLHQTTLHQYQHSFVLLQDNQELQQIIADIQNPKFPSGFLMQLY